MFNLILSQPSAQRKHKMKMICIKRQTKIILWRFIGLLHVFLNEALNRYKTRMWQSSTKILGPYMQIKH